MAGIHGRLTLHGKEDSKIPKIPYIRLNEKQTDGKVTTLRQAGS